MLRFAPSPTGDMHIGNLRVAIFNYLLSKQRDENLLIRVEDTDKERNIKGKDSEILKLLEIFGIEHHQVAYQSDNIAIHQKMAMELLIKKKAFSCFCTDEVLSQKREDAKKNKIAYRYDGTCENLNDDEVVNNEAPFVVRVKKPLNNIKFKDTIKGDFDYEPKDVDSFIILRHDKSPTYNFAASIDDMIYDISTVIRGEDHLSNTPKQIHIRNLLNYDKEIEYIHLPIILSLDGKKMSKRDESSSVIWLIKEGFVPEAITNYLILIGNKTPKDIFTLQEAIEWFDISKISKSPAKFDIAMLRHINRKHLETMDELRLAQFVGYSDKDIGKIAKLYLEESHTTNELRVKIDMIFSQKGLLKGFEEEQSKIIEAIKEIGILEDFNDLKKEITAKTSLKGKSLFMPLRYALSGAEHGPNLSDLYPLIKNYLMEIIK